MTLPSSGSLTMAQVRAEFGGAAGTPLHAYVRGGAYVPDVAGNSSVPTSPPIRLAQLLGASAYTPMSIGASNVVGATPSNSSNLLGISTCTVTGGNPSKSYNINRIGGRSNATMTRPISQDKATFMVMGMLTGSETWRWSVSDGRDTKTFDITVSYSTDGI